MTGELPNRFIIRKLILSSLVNLYSFDNTSPIRSLSGHTSFVYSVSALPDGSGAISSGEDGTMRVWSGTSSGLYPLWKKADIR
jgi:WD40 repeat protein